MSEPTNQSSIESQQGTKDRDSQEAMEREAKIARATRLRLGGYAKEAAALMAEVGASPDER